MTTETRRPPARLDPAEGGPVVRVRGLQMRYGAHDVLTGVDMEVGRGEVVVLLGPNGAGKRPRQ